MIKIILGLIIFYCVYCLLLFLIQRSVMFPRNLIASTDQNTTPKVEGLIKTYVNTSQGKVEAWYIPPLGQNVGKHSPAVIFGHGNAELIDFWPEVLLPFTQMGFGLMLVEYPGYGRSKGRPSQDSITETFVGAYDWLAGRKDVDASKIILFGRSLGGGAVCALSSKRPSAAIILMSTFTSARSFAKNYLMPGFLMRDPFDNLAVIREYSGPVLILHGQHDRVIPYTHGLKLNQAASQSHLITYSSDHNDCPPDWDIFWHDVELFLRRFFPIERNI